MISSTFFLIVIGLASLTLANGQDDTTANIASKVNEIASAQGIDIKDLEKGGEEVKRFLKEKCEKNGGPDAYDRVFAAKDHLGDCLKDLVNTTALQEEMAKARPTGDLDLVFQKYCRKKPILENCVRNFTNILEPCLEQKEKDSVKIATNVTDSLLDFICFKEGDRIALFVATGGPECIVSKREAIQDCLNSTFAGQVPIQITGVSPSLDNLPFISFNFKECSDMKKLEECVVKHLEECPDPTTGNIADSLFKFIRRATPCDNVLKAHAAARSADSEPQGSGSASAPFSFLVPILTVLSLKNL